MPIFFEWDSCFLCTSIASQRKGVRNVILEWSLRQIRGGSETYQCCYLSTNQARFVKHLGHCFNPEFIIIGFYNVVAIANFRNSVDIPSGTTEGSQIVKYSRF